MWCLGHNQTLNLQCSAPDDPFRWTIIQQCQALAPGRVNREKQSWNMWLFGREFWHFSAACRVWQHSGAAGWVVDCPLTLSQLVCQIWFGTTEGFEKFLQGLIKKPVCQAGQVCVSIQDTAGCSLLGQLSCKGFWSLLESDPGLLSSLWNPWH